MAVLNKIFSSIAKLPIIDPHSGYEINLLLNGVKKIGLILDVLPSDDVNLLQYDLEQIVKIKQDINVLDEAVKMKKLSKMSLKVPTQNNMIWNYHIFCKIGCEQQMNELCFDLFSEEGLQDKSFVIGKYLGYDNSDIHLFNNGGYDSLTPPVSYLLKKTHNFRKKCRVAAELDISPFDL